MIILRKLGFSCLNAGWIVPAYLCVSSLIRWCQLEASPLIYGTERQINSFPFLQFAHSMLIFSIVWVGVVIVFHTIRCSDQRSLSVVS